MKLINKIKPYTYLVKFKPTGKVYYGSRCQNVTKFGRTPAEDFWTWYTTSSENVNDLIAEYGKDAFEYEIRRTFDSVEQMSAWETKVLTRCRVLERQDKWLNGNIAGKKILTEAGAKVISATHKGKAKSEEHRRKISNANKGISKVNSKNQTPEYKALMSCIKSGEGNGMYGKKHSDETKKKIGEKNRVHMTGDNNPMKKVVWTEERKEHMRQIRAKRQPWTEEQKQAVAEKLRGKTRDKLFCPHCNRDIAVGWYHRHGDNCKHNKGN
jgi:hypothetical protein